MLCKAIPELHKQWSLGFRINNRAKKCASMLEIEGQVPLVLVIKPEGDTKWQ